VKKERSPDLPHELFHRRAEEPFRFTDYEGLVMPTGLRASNLREFLDLIRQVPLEVVHHHLHRSFLRHRFEVWDHPNDFSRWAASALEDHALAEKLSALDPYAEQDLEAARDAIVEIIEEHLDEIPIVPWARQGLEFHFSSGHYLALPSDREAWSLDELREALASVPLNSIYYHFHEARMRGPGDDCDDFSRWMDGQFGPNLLSPRLRGLDFYFFSLEELRQRLLLEFDQVREGGDA
jgi:hypothetical protein